MRRFFLIIAMTLACGETAEATTTTATISTTADVSTSTGYDTTSSTTWLTLDPTTGDPHPPAPECGRDMCSALGDWCAENIGSESICDTIANRICPGDPCVACEMAPKRCKFGDEKCKDEARAVCARVSECDCEYSCDDTADHLPESKQVALCFVYPWIIGEWCNEPDEGMCMDVMQGPCAPTACEYFDCLDALDTNPCTVPPACAAMQACGNLR